MQSGISFPSDSGKTHAMTALSWFFLMLGAVSATASPLSGQDLFTGKPVTVKEGKKGKVVLFMSAKCPCSNAHVPALKKLAAEFPDFSFVAIHSNSDESLESAKAYFRSFPFPVIQDEKCKLADELKALKTPHAFVIGPDDKILYKGGVTSSSSGEGKPYLRDALADLEAGKEVRVPVGRTIGCVIAR